MKRRTPKFSRGFSLLEMTVAMTLGVIVVGGAVQLFSQGVDATWVVSQKAEMQQDIRAASNILMKDLTLAGAGLPSTLGIALPAGAGVKSVYGCDQSSNCTPNGAVAYPCAPGVAPCSPTLYGIIPGYQFGIKPPGGTVFTDLVTVVYADTNFALNCYSIKFPSPAAPTPLTFTSPATNPPPSSCILPPGITFPQAANDPVVGLKNGDVLVFTQGTLQAVAEVTTVAGPAGAPAPNTAYTISFANSDVLKLNQSTATSGDLAQLDKGAGTTATRLFVVTYYLMNQPDPTGVTAGTPVLMRQVNGQTAVPVAENVVNLQFTYDTYDANGNLLNATGDGGFSLGISYNLIRKINLAHLTIRSQLAGARTALMATKGFQTFDYQTSFSARNLSYQNRYVVQ